MSSGNAFQPGAFQADAFQSAQNFLQATGMGAIADFRGEEKNRRAQDENENASRNALSRIVAEAFDGKPVRVEPETVREVLEPDLPDYTMVEQALIDQGAARIAEQKRLALKAINDRAALELLIMVA